MMFGKRTAPLTARQQRAIIEEIKAKVIQERPYFLKVMRDLKISVSSDGHFVARDVAVVDDDGATPEVRHQAISQGTLSELIIERAQKDKKPLAKRHQMLVYVVNAYLEWQREASMSLLRDEKRAHLRSEIEYKGEAL